MATLRDIHKIMAKRQAVLLDDGRIGKIVRVDTAFPSNTTIVSVWTRDDDKPPVAKVSLDRVVGPAPTRISS